MPAAVAASARVPVGVGIAGRGVDAHWVFGLGEVGPQMVPRSEMRRPPTKSLGAAPKLARKKDPSTWEPCPHVRSTVETARGSHNVARRPPPCPPPCRRTRATARSRAPHRPWRNSEGGQTWVWSFGGPGGGGHGVQRSTPDQSRWTPGGHDMDPLRWRAGSDGAVAGRSANSCVTPAGGLNTSLFQTGTARGPVGCRTGVFPIPPVDTFNNLYTLRCPPRLPQRRQRSFSECFPSFPKVRPTPFEFAQMLPKPGRHRPKWGQLRSNMAEFEPLVPEFGARSRKLGRVGPKTKFGPICGRIGADIGKHRRRLAWDRPNLARNRPNLGKRRPNLVRHVPNSADIASRSTKCGPNPTKIGADLAK